MVELKFYFVLLLIPLQLNSQKTFLDRPQNIKLLRNIKELILNYTGSTNQVNDARYDELRRQQRLQNIIPVGFPFPCNISGGRSEAVPTSVHRLRPGDIDIIGAMGDSLTAGNGILGTNLLHILVENRGASMLGGGQATWREVLTLPNILKEYNPKLFGYSSKDSYTHQFASEFNVAENAAMSKDMPYMAENLVQRIKNDSRVDLKNHWKLISIFIGANDMCSEVCWTSPIWSVLEDHKKDLINTLRILRDNLPRTIVSLIPLVNVKLQADVKDRPLICDIITHIFCSCLIGSKFESLRDEFYEITHKWQELDKEISTHPEFQKEDFTVVVQPFSTSINLPLTSSGRTDYRYFAPDWFHGSQRMQAQMTLALWKNLFEPPNEKSTFKFDDSFDLSCPSDQQPYIATSGNS